MTDLGVRPYSSHMAEGQDLPETSSEAHDTYASAYALPQYPAEPDAMRPAAGRASASTPASNDAMLLAFERARLGNRCAQGNAVSTSSRSHLLLAMNALRCTCGHGGRVSGRCVYLQILVSFVLLILGLLFDLQTLRFSMQYCTFTGMRNADKNLRCLLPRMDFGRNYHNATPYYGAGERTLGLKRHGKIQRTVEIFDDTPPGGDFMSRALALFDVMAAVQGVGNLTGSSAEGKPAEEVRADVVLAVMKAALPRDTNPEIFHYLSTDVYPSSREWNRAKWQKKHDHNDLSISTLNLITSVWGSAIEGPVRITLVFLGRVKLARALLAQRDTPVLHSVAIGTHMERHSDEMAALEVKTRLERVLLKTFFGITLPAFFGFGLGAYNLLDPEPYVFFTPFWTVCRFASFLMTVSAFTFAPLIWSHIDTHIKNVRRTGQMCTGLMLTESHNGEGGGNVKQKEDKVDFIKIARHYAEVVYSLDVFCREWSELVCFFLIAAGSPALTSTISVCKLISEGRPVPSPYLIVLFSTGCVVTTVLGKMASVKTEHDRLRDFVSLRRLGGCGGPSHSEGRRPSGPEVKENDDAVLVLINLSKSRGAVRIFGNTKVTYGVMMAVPEALLALIATALLPVIASEISGGSS